MSTLIKLKEPQFDCQSLAKKSIRNITPYQPGKPIEELEREMGISNSIKLASNENPLGPSHRVILAAQEALLNAHLYPDGSCYELKKALAAHLTINAAQITVGNGSENILELIVKSFLHEDDNAVISQYAFLTIQILIQSSGATMKVAPAPEFGHDIAAMRKLVDHKTRILFLVNPNNPTGTYTTEAEFRWLMESLPPQVLVVVDEAYVEYITLATFPNTLDYLAHYPNLIITRTFSKAYGLAALRLGYAISSPAIADILNRARLPFNVNTIAAKAACVALEDKEHIKKTVALNQQGIAIMQDELKQMGLSTIPSIANFVTVDVTDGVSIYQRLLQEGVIVRPLHPYGLPRHIRITIGTNAQNQRCLQALQRNMVWVNHCNI